MTSGPDAAAAAAGSEPGQTVFSPGDSAPQNRNQNQNQDQDSGTDTRTGDCTEGVTMETEASGSTEPELMEVEALEEEGPSHTEDVPSVQQDSVQDLIQDPVQEPAEQVVVDQKAVDRLTEGFLSHYLPDLQSSKRALQELTQNQLVLLDTLDQEVTKFRDCNALLDLNSLFTEAKVYHNKLVNIRKEMIMLHEKTTKLKKRALKLQQQKQKEALEKEQLREKELERERQLIAKPAKRS